MLYSNFDLRKSLGIQPWPDSGPSANNWAPFVCCLTVAATLIQEFRSSEFLKNNFLQRKVFDHLNRERLFLSRVTQLGGWYPHLVVGQPTKAGWASELCWLGQEFVGRGPNWGKNSDPEKIGKNIIHRKRSNFRDFFSFSTLGTPF